LSFFAKTGIEFKPRPANILGREIISMTTTKPGQWAKAYKELYYKSKAAEVTNFAIHIFEENVYTPVRDYICLRYPCGAAREVISVNPDGTVYPCDGFKGEPRFSMGNILEESLDEMLQKEWIQTLRNRTAQSIAKCSKCIYRAMCCSCCYSAYGAYGTVYREDPHCSDRRKIFEFLMDQWIIDNIN
jgi:radical SAM protein with 4Fe4S-binding SPASM domain